MPLRLRAGARAVAACKFNTAFSAILRLGDPVLLVVGALGAHWLRFGTFAIALDYGRLVSITLLFALLVLGASTSLYGSWRGRGVLLEIAQLSLRWTIVFIGLVLYATAIQVTDTLSRLWLGGWFGLSLTFVILLRLIVRGAAAWVRSRGMDLRSAVIVGANPDAQRIVDVLQHNVWAGIDLRGWFATSADRGELAGAAALGKLEGLERYVQLHGIDQVWVALPMRDEAAIAATLQQLQHSTADIKFVPDLFGMQLLNHSVEQVAGLPVINLRSSPLDGNAYLVKSVMDRVLGALILLLIAPLLVAIAAGVKLSSPGPILFRQARHGMSGRPIEVWKFRSMRVHCEDGGQVTQARRGDARITPFGAFLRRTSLDELPQFFNVLQGSMSIVGPRPHALAHNEQYKDLVDQYMQRHRVKPGITGWAQVNGLRGETDTVEKMARRVEYDLYYLQNWSPWFDLRIILMTTFKGFAGSNAY